MTNNNFIEKLKNIVIIILILIIIFGGAYISSFIRELRNECNCVIEEEKKFNNITIEEYISLFKNEKLSLIYIGREDCTFANAQNTVFYEVLEEYDITVNYLDLNTLDSEDINILYTSYDKFLEEGLSTPTIMLVQNKEVKLYQKGYLSIESLLKILKENNFIIE